MKKVNNTISFINEAIKKHGYKYDYSLVNYINSKYKVSIICPVHGIFEQIPSTHIFGHGAGCKKCANDSYKTTIKNFISQANIIHENKYDYSLLTESIETSRHQYIKIICSRHGIFTQRKDSHLLGYGCKVCTKEKELKKMENKFLENSKVIHNNKFDYSLASYKGRHEKIKIICSKHGIFYQTPHNHLSGKGCTFCKESKGEKTINKFLTDNNINFIREYRFNDCKLKNTLPFDFYLPEYNICIEFNGKQHYESNKHFGGDKGFKETIKRDKIKLKYCSFKNIELITIKYNENINKKLTKLIIQPPRPNS